MMRRTILALALSPFLLTNAYAGPIVDLAQQAEQLISKGDGIDAYEKMRQSMVSASAKIPLSIRKAFFVKEKARFFGDYQKVPGDEFPVGSSLITYAEPVGLSWSQAGNEKVQVQFTVDFALSNPAGETLAEGKAIGNFRIVSQEPLFEIYTPLTLDVSAIPSGNYVVKYTFNDLNAKKSTSIDQRFVLK